MDELTEIDFIAYILYGLDQLYERVGFVPLWLCLRPEIRDEYRAKARAKYDEFVDSESRARFQRSMFESRITSTGRIK